MSEDVVVHVIDDDDAVRHSLTLLLEMSGLLATAHESALAFLEVVSTLTTGGCIIADIRMPGMDGLELQRTLTKKGVTLPVIIMTGHADVPIAVQALKNGAVDFIEKPFSDDVLLTAVRTALEVSQQTRSTQTRVVEIQQRLDTLTAREKEVLEGLLIGHPNKTIAFDLSMSPRTVEVHRARIMQKMQARSLSELIRMIMSVRK
ncbi:MAG: response regulator [Rhodospirillaceae bacterium]|nr:MAG: response regulator [Rhodospirillaceae bacterium]